MFLGKYAVILFSSQKLPVNVNIKPSDGEGFIFIRRINLICFFSGLDAAQVLHLDLLRQFRLSGQQYLNHHLFHRI